VKKYFLEIPVRQKNEVTQPFFTKREFVFAHSKGEVVSVFKKKYQNVYDFGPSITIQECEPNAVFGRS
jgi:hypothetical protein